MDFGLHGWMRCLRRTQAAIGWEATEDAARCAKGSQARQVCCPDASNDARHGAPRRSGSEWQLQALRASSHTDARRPATSVTARLEVQVHMPSW